MLLPVAAATLLTLLIALTIATIARLQAILPPNRPPAPRRRSISTTAAHKHIRNNSDGTNRPRRLDRAGRDDDNMASPGYPYKHIMVVLGSGGHTAEMLLMLQRVEVGMQRWATRTWVVSSGDGFSAGLAAEFEERLRREGAAEISSEKRFDVVELPRARKVHQSLVTAPVTSLICLWAALKMLLSNPPDIILTNGPGTGVIVVLASLILRFLGLGTSWKTRCVYVESLARCKTLSLSGRLLKPVVDRVLVQWKELEDGRAEFKGCYALDAAVAVGLDGVKDENVADRRTWITYEL